MLKTLTNIRFIYYYLPSDTAKEPAIITNRAVAVKHETKLWPIIVENFFNLATS